MKVTSLVELTNDELNMLSTSFEIKTDEEVKECAISEFMLNNHLPEESREHIIYTHETEGENHTIKMVLEAPIDQEEWVNE